MNADGDVLAVWERAGRVLARIVGHDGKLGKLQPLGPGHDPRLDAALATHRRAVVAWATRTGVRQALAGLGGHFKATRLIERFPRLPSLPACGVRAVAVDFTTPLRTVATWTARVGDRLAVHAAAGGGSVQTISDPAHDSCLANLAVGPTGEAAILVAQDDGALVDALRDPAATQFGPLEPLTAGAGPGAAFAFDPATQRLVAVWVDDQGTLQSATRAVVTS
jgi:hypothetical protein